MNEGEDGNKRSRVIFSKNGQIRYQKGPSSLRDGSRDRPKINASLRHDSLKEHLVKEEAEQFENSPTGGFRRSKDTLHKSPKGKTQYL